MEVSGKNRGNRQRITGWRGREGEEVVVGGVDVRGNTGGRREREKVRERERI